MADVINAVNTGARFAPHPEGQFGVVCVDCIDLGERVESFQGQPARVVKKCALVFWSGERNPDTRDMHEVSAEFTVSMHEKSGLRLLLEAWRGKSYTDAEARQGVPLHKLVGQPALVSVEHKPSKAGRTYAKIKSIAPLPKGMARPEIVLDEYARPDFWTERKKQYADEVRTFRGQQTRSHDDDFSDFPSSLEQGDDLPF